MADSSSNQPTVGFLTIDDDAEHGLLGGYLLLNTFARPLEFHCTSPVRPTRSQEILYGSELKPYLYGEQIGKTLVLAAKSKPAFLCTDVMPALNVRHHIDLPTILVGDDDTRERNSLCTFTLGGYQVGMGQRWSVEQGTIRNHWQAIDNDYDLSEPFQRIRQALEEAKRSLRSAA